MGIGSKIRGSLYQLRMGKDTLPERKVLIGTHHKSGTAWLYKIFAEIAGKTNKKFYYGKPDHLPDQFDFFMEDHSRFSEGFLGQIDYRGVHLIRDPRDIVISGMFYHKKSDERWLHEPRDEFAGLTYQQKLNSIESLDDQIEFEMRNASYHEAVDIRNWDYSNANFIELRYEDLIEDYELKLFQKMFEFLGFRGKAIPFCLDIAYANSIFSGRVKKSLHVRSGSTRQWEKYFGDKHRKLFLDMHGDALIRLGYEQNNDWVSDKRISE